MFIGLEDFDIDIFLRLDDENIDIYYTDFETLPQLANIVPLGSFDSDGKLKLIKLPMEDRIKIGIEFFHRDGFAEYKGNSFDTLIKVDAFLNQFGNIPEVVDFFEPYLQKCESSEPPEWCTDCNDLQTECPEYCDKDFSHCSINIPINEFYKIKGSPRLKFGVSVPGADFETHSNIVNIKAKIITKDSDGSEYSSEDTRTFDLNLVASNSAIQSPGSGSITINIMGTINTGTPTITGTAENLLGSKLEIIIEDLLDSSNPTRNYTAFYNSEGNWSLKIPQEDILNDSSYKITAVGYDENNTGTVIETEGNFIVDTKAEIVFTNISDGYINWEEYQHDLLIAGEVQAVEVNQEVRINLNGKNYYTNVMSDLSFSILIPNTDVRELRHNTGYLISAYVTDVIGNQAIITEKIFVDLVQPNPTIQLDPTLSEIDIKEAIQIGDYLYIEGMVGGDAVLGDKVIVYVNSKPFVGEVRADYFIPDPPPANYEIDYSDLYYLVILYFNGIYRTNPEKAENLGIYNVLTDINFELNDYAMIINIKEFFTKEFIYFLKTSPGSLPFGNDFGTNIKLAVQTKNSIVRELEIQGEINYFIQYFNLKYGDLVNIKTINIINQESDIGADSWLIEVYADIKQDRLIYRLEI